MRVIKTISISILTVGLLAGSAVGAAAQDEEPTWVTGTIQAAPSCSGPDVELVGNVLEGDPYAVRQERNTECSPQLWTSSDPRLTGEVSRRWSVDVYGTDEGTVSVETGAAYLRNDGGGWACSSSVLATGEDADSVTGPSYVLTCIGEGGYAGLSAILGSEWFPSANEEFVGLIFPGEFPPLPEPPAAE